MKTKSTFRAREMSERQSVKEEEREGRGESNPDFRFLPEVNDELQGILFYSCS